MLPQIQSTNPDLAITGATIVTCDGAHTIIEDGTILVSGDCIAAIGPSSQLATSAKQARNHMDARGKIAMPGLINTHCHAGDSLFRGLVEGLTLEPWLEKLWIAESAVLTPETVYLGSMLGYLENLRNGVTTLVDMFWHPHMQVKAAEAAGLRIATGGIFFDPPGIDGLQASQRVEAAHDFFTEYGDHPSLIPSVSIHGTYTVGPENLHAALKVSDDYNALINIHAAETRAEQATIQERFGKRVIEHMSAKGILTPRTILAHCVHLNDVEIDLIRQKGAHISHNPASNLKLGSGIAPIPTYLQAEIPVGLGTDGAVSGNDLDMWKAIRLAAVLHNGANEDALAVSAEQAVMMATRTGAQMLGLGDEVGSLETGKRADIILLNPDQLHSIPVFRSDQLPGLRRIA